MSDQDTARTMQKAHHAQFKREHPKWFNLTEDQYWMKYIEWLLDTESTESGKKHREATQCSM